MRRTTWRSCGALAMATAAAATPALAAPAADPLAAVAAGKPILDLRARYEEVDQANLVPDAWAYTVRARFGWETAAWNGFKALVEGEAVGHLDAGDYNVAPPGGASLNGRPQYPIINDPSVLELNRAQLSWTASPAFTATAGRQRILVDDQRFVGNVGWRQDEQTFDAARGDAKLGPVTATYAYVWQVNRILGQKADWRSDSHLFNAVWPIDPHLRLEGFVYALDFPTAPLSSTLTRGARATGKARAGDAALAYEATYARQSPYGANPGAFGLDFWQASGAATWRRATLKADYEQLNGDGVHAFVTPLATTHAFQGWADAWAAVGGNKIHVDGLKDLNFTLVLKPKSPAPFLRNPEILVRRHDFWAERTGAKLAAEWDAQVQAGVTPKLTCALKYADFRREAQVPAGTTLAPPSRRKVWLTLEFKL
ncbi:MAG TPA: hypothetical protein VG939_15840 [Caulobacteraceae bacterium]|nr:hypothetical protein [Caulobacteraceae bacterium]